MHSQRDTIDHRVLGTDTHVLGNVLSPPGSLLFLPEREATAGLAEAEPAGGAPVLRRLLAERGLGLTVRLSERRGRALRCRRALAHCVRST